MSQALDEGRHVKVSELIAELQALMAEHGDLPVYSIVDHEYVTGVFCDEVRTGGDGAERPS